MPHPQLLGTRAPTAPPHRVYAYGYVHTKQLGYRSFMKCTAQTTACNRAYYERIVSEISKQYFATTTRTHEWIAAAFYIDSTSFRCNINGLIHWPLFCFYDR